MLHRKPDLAHLNQAAVTPGLGQSRGTGQESRQRLLSYLQDHTPTLLGTLRLYVLRAGLASGEQVQAVALEILQETVVEALAHAERYHSDGQPMAWLLGIAINMIRRRKTTNARLATREISLARLSLQASQPISEADLLDQLIPDPQNGPEQEIEADEQAHALLALVSDEDQRILRLALLDGFDRAALAERLGTSAGTARMRLHRALNRLRAAWSTRERNPQGEIQDE